MPSPDLDLDNIDLEHLRECVESRGWQLIQQRIERCAADTVRALCSDLPHEETVKKRGLLKGLQYALEVPALIKSELKGKS